MEFDKVVEHRRSIREYKSKRVSWKNIIDAIDAALQGPYAGNHNNLKFLIVEEKDTIKEIASFCEQEWVAKAAALVLVCSDDTNLENMYGERGRIYSRQQAGAAIQTLLLKFVDMGLGACWIGSYSDELIKLKLKIPQHIQIEAIVSVGYPDHKPEKKEKKNLENALFWEEWWLGRRPSLFEEKTTDRPNLSE